MMTVPIQAALKATKQHPQILPKPPANPGSAGEDCPAVMQSLCAVYLLSINYIYFKFVEYCHNFFKNNFILTSLFC